MAPMEIIILVIGVLAFVASFFLGKKEQSEEEKFSEEEIKRLVEKEFEATKYKLEDAAEDAVAEASEKAERSMEKITNEKMLALGEYSDNIMTQISTNHQETVFMYDMLTRNKEELVGFLENTKQEATDAYNKAREATDLANSATEESRAALIQSSEALQRTLLAEESALSARKALVETPEMTYEDAVYEKSIEEAIGEDTVSFNDRTAENLELISPTETPYMAPILEETYEPVAESFENLTEIAEVVDPSEAINIYEAKETSAYEELYGGLAEEIAPVEDKPESKEEKSSEEPKSIKDLIQKTNAVQKARKSVNTNTIKAALQKQADPTTFQFDSGSDNDNNARIIALHKKGKSNMAIAKELGLGVGEVNLVIGLYDK